MTFTQRLMTWYYANQRDLPFRHSKDPYAIWVSEIMAQQTQITTMIPYYLRWIKTYPNVQALAQADIEDILKLWEGLGYYRRARNLHRGAHYIMEHFAGVIPDTKEALLQIPGIGDYTSSAIASIAFDQPEIVIDGNVKRVMARFLNYTENVNTAKAHRTFELFLKQELLAGGANPGDFNQALMELGALVYTPANTQCLGSPFKELCACYRGENTIALPVIAKPAKAIVLEKSVFIITDDDNILMSTDDDDGLMKGLLRLPQLDGHHTDHPAIYSLKHKFSHREWNIQVYAGQSLIAHSSAWFWLPVSDLPLHPIITAHKKIIQHLGLMAD